jgi:selenide,water dikinase
MMNTIDFITPPVDDPYWSSQISAADSISDVYSMGGNKANRAMVAKHVLVMPITLSNFEDELLYNPQTSGGLLLSVPKSQADKLLSTLHRNGVSAATCIGEVTDEPIGITVE